MRRLPVQIRGTSFSWFFPALPTSIASRLSIVSAQRASIVAQAATPESADSPGTRASAARRSVSFADAGVALHWIDLRVPVGALVAICGPVGSGKTSLLHAVLGEMYARRDLAPNSSVSVLGYTVYVPQQSWLLNATVIENICFGLPYDAARFRVVVEACCLESDIAGFPDGLEQMIGK